MSLHFDIATEGLRKDHRWIARLGMFQVEVIVEPTRPTDTGGAWFGEPQSRITVRVTYKGKSYEQSMLTPIPDVSLIGVVAKIAGIKRKIIEVFAKVVKFYK